MSKDTMPPAEPHEYDSKPAVPASSYCRSEKHADTVLRRMARISLPKSAGNLPGLLCSVVRDDHRNLYYSDEINHTVTSLDGNGRLRWILGGKGKAPGNFVYPRGLALGWSIHKGVLRRSLCVCDAWNSRVQLFEPDGAYLGSWCEAGNLGFSEVCDVRYLAGQSPSDEAQACWLVLDRGNHRLCALGLDGRLLFQTGRAFIPSLEAQWAKPGLEPVTDPAPKGTAHDYRPYDPLFYPTRILGHSETALYLYEPAQGRLKQPLLGNLLPLALHLPEAADWIAADSDLFLSWEASSQRLRWFDASGKLRGEASAEGRPVASDLPSDQIWMHTDDHLDLHSVDRSSLGMEPLPGNEPFRALWCSALQELESSDLSRGPVKELLDKAASYIELCDDVLRRISEERCGVSALKEIRDRAGLIGTGLQQAAKGISRSVQPLFLSALKLRLLSQSAWCDAVGFDLESARASFTRHAQPIVDAMVEALRCIDETAQLRRCLYELNPTVAPDMDRLLESQCSELFGMIVILQFWSGTVFASADLVSLPSAPDSFGETRETLPGRWLRQPSARVGNISSRCLREVDRIRVAPSDDNAPSNPNCLASAPGGHFYVGHYSSGRLLHLDAEGRVLEELFGPECRTGTLSGPFGLTVDLRDRLWIVEHDACRVRMFDPTSGEQSIVDGSRARTPLTWPAGICLGPANSVLVTDRWHNRVARISEARDVAPFAGRPGTGPGEFRRPLSVCPDGTEAGAGFWVTDESNHRLQKFDSTGRFVRQIGKCGPGPGSFVFPQQIAQFPDGALVVSQMRVDRSLRLISPQGEELDRLFLDYAPGGVLVFGETLFVTELTGHHMRVYERISG